MGLLSKEVQVKLNKKNLKYYRDLGYSGNLNDIITVDVNDLQSGSGVNVECLCDYCQKEVVTMSYYHYVKRTKEVNKVACKNCKGLKQTDVVTLRYGEGCKQRFMKKGLETFRKNTGYDHPSQSPDVKEKKVQAYLDHYGVCNPQQSAEVRERTEQTNLEKYGCIAPSQNEEIKEKAFITNLRVYGVPYTQQNPEVRAKANETLNKNGNQKTSRQQIYIYQLYNTIVNAEINFPVSYYAVDICFPEERIIVEYDGGGHDLRVKLGRLTQEEFNQKEIVRDSAVKYAGYKIMRIRSLKDRLPSDSILLQMLQETRNYFQTTPRTWQTYDLDSSLLFNAENKQGIPYSFGELHTLPNTEMFPTNNIPNNIPNNISNDISTTSIVDELTTQPQQTT